MRCLTLATDYDGTLAHHGVVDAATITAVERARAAGLRLVLVTGRELNSLAATFPRMDLFDRIVAENGAVLYNPAMRSLRVLTTPPPAALVARLTTAQIPLEIGHAIVATVEPHEHTVLAAIRDLGLEWHVVFNKGAVMALPSGVTKATGLAPALEDLGVTPDTTVGIGDAQNDHAFLQLCRVSVAVANALPAVKATARLVTAGSHGVGVAEVIDLMLRDAIDDEIDRATEPPSSRP